jgi:hypothetical protein
MNTDFKGGTMPQYGILLFSPAPADPMAVSPEYLAALEEYPAHMDRLGVKPVTGFAFQPSTAAKSVSGGAVKDGTFFDSDLVVAGYFVVEAPNMEAAVEIGRLNPATMEGGVEVRPLFEPPAE